LWLRRLGWRQPRDLSLDIFSSFSHVG
jgi:hypothetical protein